MKKAAEAKKKAQEASEAAAKGRSVGEAKKKATEAVDSAANAVLEQAKSVRSKCNAGCTEEI